MENKIIGIVDFDFLSTKELCNYNFGVLLVSSYYLERGTKVRLILDLSYDNLIKYDKIYIFKDYKTKIKPINLIKNYYSLPIEEYGEGFTDKSLFPNLPNLIYTKIKTDIYKPILYYIEKGGDKFSLSKTWNNNYIPTKIFYELDNELLLREEPKGYRLLIYDEPTIFYNTILGRQKMTEMLKSSIIKFVKPVHIGIIEPKYWEEIFHSKSIVKAKNRLYANHDDPYLDSFIDWSLMNIKGNLDIAVNTTDGLQWFKKRGGKIYGKYRNNEFKGNDQEGVGNSSSKENISTWNKWTTTTRFSKNNRSSRERIDEKERRKYLPSEYRKRYLERRKTYKYKRGR